VTTLAPTGLLEQVAGPADLRRLTLPELAALAGEVRRVLVESVAANGGHLGSNLGVVELTFALHRAFDSPRETIIWDTGHQAYVHKLVTGRRDRFGSLRRAGGLSGYPNRGESGHDMVENSHASTAVSYAVGVAAARRLAGDDRAVVAVVGDGALTGGLAYEGLNNLGCSGLPVMVVLNDNGRSYAPTTSRLSTAGSGTDPGGFFRALGLDYIGPVDGHDMSLLEDVLREARRRCPVVVHVITRKGKGYPPAEEDAEKCLHDVTSFDPVVGPPPQRLGGNSFTAAFADALVALGERRPDVVAITAAMPGSTGLLPFQRQFPDRCFDVGIAEQHALTTAAGMAMAGLRPVVAIYATFLNRAWDQLCYDVGLHRLPVVLCVDRAGVTGEDGPSHHGVLDLALLTKVPGLTVLVPSCLEDVPTMLDAAIEQPGPVALRWPKTPGRRLGRHPPPATSAEHVRAGRDVCLLGVGTMAPVCEAAADMLGLDGIDATVWDVRSVVPLDGAMIADACRHDHVVTVEDGIAAGGAGCVMRDAIAERGVSQPRVRILGAPTAYLPHGAVGDILHTLGLDPPGVAATVRAALGHGPNSP
jgi:1-deoxy-D-xylulose-5-phosphate synthase